MSLKSGFAIKEGGGEELENLGGFYILTFIETQYPCGFTAFTSLLFFGEKIMRRLS